MNDEPKLMKGSGIPVIGMSPMVMPTFSSIWKVHIAMMPTAIREPNRSRADAAISSAVMSKRQIQAEQDHRTRETELLTQAR